MAITKILNINQAKEGNPATHLENAIAYIQNPDKTEECVLVGSVNCLPDTAFAQMVDTKEAFGKTGKRQGYHIIISFPPGEAAPEQAMEVTRRFVEEHLQNEYEAVYAVHTDKEHCHGHIIFNSVNMVTGEKYISPKGNWKYHLQPLTNKLCQELGLSIMPAEYSKNPVNMSKDKWEYEQSFKEYILADVKMCLAYAGSLEHFVFLMKRLGYEFKGKDYMSIRVPGMKLYHRLDKLDVELTRENLKYWFGNGEYSYFPKYYSRSVPYLKRAKLTPLQKRHYAKMYRLGLVEKRRFIYHSAELAAEIRRMQVLQKEYLFLCDNDVHDTRDLLDIIENKEKQIADISVKQQGIYKENAARKRACKTPENFREYQLWHLEQRKILDDLKAQKKELKEQIKTGKSCLKENTAIAMGIVDATEELSFNETLEVPVMYEFEKREIAEEFEIGEKVEKRELPNIEIDDGAGLAKTAGSNKTITEADAAELPKTELPIRVPLVMEEGLMEETLYGEPVSDGVVERIPDVDGEKVYKEKIDEIKQEAAVEDEWNIIPEIDSVSPAESIRRKGNTLEEKVSLICDYIQNRYGGYGNMSVRQKADCFDFRVDDTSYDIKLHGEVLRKLKIQMCGADLFEDFQGIFDETMRRMENSYNNNMNERMYRTKAR